MIFGIQFYFIIFYQTVSIASCLPYLYVDALKIRIVFFYLFYFQKVINNYFIIIV